MVLHGNEPWESDAISMYVRICQKVQLGSILPRWKWNAATGVRSSVCTGEALASVLFQSGLNVSDMWLHTIFGGDGQPSGLPLHQAIELHLRGRPWCNRISIVGNRSNTVGAQLHHNSTLSECQCNFLPS